VIGKKLEIFGAGSIGMLIATRYKNYASDIKIYETSSYTGGVVKDFSNGSGEHYFLGCQYLLEKQIPTDLINELNLIEFSHHYASITEQGNKHNYKLDFAGPAFDLDFTEHSQNNINWKNTNDKLQLYPNPIKLYLESFINKVITTNPDQLHISSLTALGLNRVTSMTNDNELLRIKNKNNLLDNLYGVSRKVRKEAYEVAYIPKEGYNSFWKNLGNILKNYSHLELFLQTRITSKYLSNFTSIPDTSLKLWCADPRYLVRHLKKIKLQSLNYSVCNFGLSVQSYVGPKLPFYINVFSTKTPFLRLFFYQTLSQVKLTIESIMENMSQQDIVYELNKILQDTNIELKINKNEMAAEKTKRYFPITNSDFRDIYDTFLDMKDDNWIDTGAYLYDRKSRFELITSQLDNQMRVTGA
jgi:hypothetical protein